MSNSTGIVTSLSIFPVKSMRGITLDSASVEWLGLQGDRRYLVVDSDGVFITQRNLPSLATVQPLLSELALTLTCDSFGEILIPHNIESVEVRVTIWKDQVAAQDMGDEVSSWLSSALNMQCRLVKVSERTQRQIDLDFAKPNEFVSFADGYPILLANQASLDDLNSRMEVGLPMNRFRPNIVVEGFNAWEEDDWSEIQVGEISFRVAKPCARCRVTTQDQTTGIRHGEEPLATLAKFRNVGKKVIFGQNLIPNCVGETQVGDHVKIVGR